MPNRLQEMQHPEWPCKLTVHLKGLVMRAGWQCQLPVGELSEYLTARKAPAYSDITPMH